MGWAVVGGGMLGLTLALRLRQQGKSVTLFEGADRLGGLASAWKLGDVVWDRHYHVTLLSDTALRAVLGELDLDSTIDWRVTKTGFYARGKLSSMSNAVEYLQLPALNPIEKMRLAATIVHGARVTDWQALEEVSVEEWLTRLSGKSTFRKLWLPLLRAKLGEGYKQANAAFIWATIQRLYAARRTGLKREMFGSVRGGYARVFERFDEVLRGMGVEIRLSAPVERIEPGREGGVNLTIRGCAPESFEGCVVTAPAPVVPGLCPSLTAEERSRYAAITYQGIVCASVLLKRPLVGYYLTYITDDDCPFTAIVEMSTLVDPKYFGGHSLVYLPKYAAASESIFALSDDEVEERFLTALARMVPSFRRDDVLAFRISRVKNVFPIPTLGYSRTVPEIETSVPGLFVVSSANIVNGTLNVNETVQLAEKTAKRLAGAAIPVVPIGQARESEQMTEVRR